MLIILPGGYPDACPDMFFTTRGSVSPRLADTQTAPTKLTNSKANDGPRPPRHREVKLMRGAIDLTVLEPHGSRFQQLRAAGEGSETAAYMLLGVSEIAADPWTGGFQSAWCLMNSARSSPTLS